MLTKLLLLGVALFVVLRLIGARTGRGIPGLRGAVRQLPAPRRCKACGAPVPGQGGCPCGHG